MIEVSYFKMVLKKISTKKIGKGKPTRFRFKGKTRLGFKNNRVVEITKFRRR